MQYFFKTISIFHSSRWWKGHNDLLWISLQCIPMFAACCQSQLGHSAGRASGWPELSRPWLAVFETAPWCPCLQKHSSVTPEVFTEVA